MFHNDTTFVQTVPVTTLLRSMRQKQVCSLQSVTRRRYLASACAADPSIAFVLSHFEAADLLSLRTSAPEDDDEVIIARGEFSLDLGLRTEAKMAVLRRGIAVPTETSNAVVATWEELQKMTKKGRAGAFEVFSDGLTTPQRINAISTATGRALSLIPVARTAPPTLVLSGFTMHRVVQTDPEKDTASKLDAIGVEHLRGHVLDVCTGLGYTALGAATTQSVDTVTTVERDPAVIEMLARNPWSRPLLGNSCVRQLIGDANTVIADLEGAAYDVIIHDPPVQSLASDLYGASFYTQLHRVSKSGAVLFHYVGDPNSKDSGRLYRGIAKRLEQVGFRDVRKVPAAYGVRAVRS